jgi:hypothetical protein
MIPTGKCDPFFLHGIKEWGFVMDTEFFYCAVRAESLIVEMYHIHIMPWIRRLVAQGRVLTQITQYEPCGGKVALSNSVLPCV